MPPALLDFLKRNAKFLYGGGVIGAAALAGDVKGVADADNKFKALLRTMLDFIKIRIAVAGVFTGVATAIRNLVKETGSLEAALRRLQQMQIASRAIAPFVGGLSAARERMAQLATLSERGPFDFGQLAEANKSLEVFTRGAYSSVAATQKIGEVAITTGNSIEDVARTVGVFYDDLREGRPIGSAAEQLRQMGAISQDTKDHLVGLASSGRDVVGVFNELTASLVTAGGGYENELAQVTAAHEKAAEELKVKFGAPWTENDVQNTKNYTTALRAITPVVGEISRQFAGLYNGLSTFTSSLVKAAATSKVVQIALQGLAVALQLVTVAAAAYGTVVAVQVTRSLLNLAPVIANSTSALLLWLNIGARVALVATAWGLVAAAAITVGVALYRGYTQMDAFNEQLKKQAQLNREVNAGLAKQIAQITTLADKQEAYIKVIDALIESENKLAEIRKKQHPAPVPTTRTAGSAEAQMGRDVAAAAEAQRQEQLKLEEKQTQEQIEIRRKYADKVAAVSVAGPERVAQIEAEERRRQFLEDERKGAFERARIAEEGQRFAVRTEEQRERLDRNIAEGHERELNSIKKLTDARKETQSGKLSREKEKEAGQQIAKDMQKVTSFEKERQQLALKGPEESAAAIGARAEQLRQARLVAVEQANVERLRAEHAPRADVELAKARLERATQLSGGREFNAGELARLEAREKMAREREASVPQLQEDARAAREQQMEFTTQTAAISAKATGDFRKAFRLEDLSKFMRTFQDLRPVFGPEAAKQMAIERTKADIQEQYAQAGNVVGYLQSIGGGGGLPQAGVDIQQRMVDLLKSIDENTKKASEIEHPEPTQDPAYFF